MLLAQLFAELGVPTEFGVGADRDPFSFEAANIREGDSGEAVPASALNFSHIAVANRRLITDTPSIVIVVEATVSHAVAGNVQPFRSGNFSTDGFTDVALTRIRDSARVPSGITQGNDLEPNIAQVAFKNNAAAASGARKGAFALLANQPWKFEFPIILTNDESYGFREAAINLNITGHFAWVEAELRRIRK